MLLKKKILLVLLSLVFSLFSALGLAFIFDNNSQAAFADTSDYSDAVCALGGEPVVYATNTVRFTSETFGVSFLVDESIEILSVDFEKIGVGVLSYDIGDNNLIDIQLILEEGEERKLSAHIEGKDDVNLTAQLFVIENEYGIFVSPFSKYDAYENYFVYAKNLGVMTEEECQAIRNDLNKDSVISESYVILDSDNVQSSNALSQEDHLNNSGVSALANKDTYVKGTLQWIDDNGTIHPLRGAMVYAFAKKWSIPISSGPIYTDNSGNFTCTFQLNSTLGEYDLTVQVYAGDLNAYVKMGSGTAYVYEFTEPKKITAGETKECGEKIFTMDSDLGRAMQISQAAMTARDFAWAMSGNKPADVTICYPTPINTEKPDEDPGTFYSHSENTVYVSGYPRKSAALPQSYASWDAIMHEYGHHVSYEMGTIEHQSGESGHDISKNLIDIYQKEYKKTKGMYMAWYEAWPTAFALIAQNYYGDKITSIETVNNVFYEAYNFSEPFNIENCSTSLGEGCESSITAVLWDLFDSDYDPNDFIGLGHQGFWDVTATHGSKTFSDFINVFYETYPDDIDKIAFNLWHYGMAADDLTIVNETLYTLPRLSWAAKGGSEKYPNNRFVIVFKDSDHNEICRTSELSDTKYQLNDSEWEKIVRTPGNRYGWTVYAYQDDGDGHKTGPYITYSLYKNKPVPPSVEVDVPVNGEIGHEGDYKWYKFVAPQTGSYTFYTEGSTDTYGELYKEYSYSLIMNASYKSNDDGGNGGNFSITDTLARNAVIYIRVSAFEDCEGSFTLKVRYNGHEHVYTAGYTKYDTYWHYSYCECGAYVQEWHDLEIEGKHEWCNLCDYDATYDDSVPGGTIQSVGDDDELFVDDNRRRVTA